MIATMATSSSLRSYTTARFRELLQKLPPDAKKLAHKYFKTFMTDPWAPALDRKPLQSSEGLEFVKVGLHYRAFFRKGLLPEDENVVVWEWIGTTEEAHNYYWKQFPITDPTPNRPVCRRRSKSRPFMKTWKQKRYTPEETMPMAVEEPESRPETHESEPKIVMPQSVVYTGIAAQLEGLLSQINEIETKKTKAEKDAEDGLSEILRLEGEKKDLVARVEKLEKSLQDEKHSLALAISRSREATISHRHEVESVTRRAEASERENNQLKQQVVSLQKKLRKLGEFCRHCGKNYETGLRPGETD